MAAALIRAPRHMIVPIPRETRLADRAELESDQNEDDPVQEKDEQIPDGSRLNSRGRSHQRAEALTDIEAADHTGKHGRGLRSLGDDPGGIGRQKRDGGLGQAVVRETERPAGSHAHDQADEDTAR